MYWLNIWLTDFPKLLRRLPRIVLAIFTLLFIFIILKVHPYDGSDFRWYWSLGRAVIEDVNPFVMSELNTLTKLHPVPFDFHVMPYPASTGLMMVPFALLKFSTSAYLFKIISTITLVIGTISVLKSLESKSVSLWKYFPIILVLLLWSPVRWAASNLQLITLITGLYGIFISLTSDRQMAWRVVIFVGVLGLKFTAVLPFLIMFILLKQWKALTLSVTLGTALVFFSFVFTGFPNSLFDYIQNLKEFSKFEGPADAISPYVHDAGIRLDLSYFLNGFFVYLPYVTALSVVIASLMTLVIIRYGSGDFSSDRGKMTLVATTGVGLLWTYQHVYAWVYFVPIFATLLCESTWIRVPFTPRIFVTLILLYGYTTATNVTTYFLRKNIGEFAVIIFRTYPSFLLVALTVTSLIYMWRHDVKSRDLIAVK
jgi:hypothetical protein